MSPKELMYIDDALGHTQFMQTQCGDAAGQLTDAALRQQAKQLADTNRQLFQQFLDLV